MRTVVYYAGVLTSCVPLHHASDGSVFAVMGSDECRQRFILAMENGVLPKEVVRVSAIILRPDHRALLYEDGRITPLPENVEIARRRGRQWASTSVGEPDEAAEIARMWVAYYAHEPQVEQQRAHAWSVRSWAKQHSSTAVIVSIIVLQLGMLGVLATRHTSSMSGLKGFEQQLAMTQQAAQRTYELTAEERDSDRFPPGSYVLVKFSPFARLVDLNNFIEKQGFTIVDGPRGTNYYRLKVGSEKLSKSDYKHAVARIEQEKPLVTYVLQAPPDWMRDPNEPMP